MSRHAIRWRIPSKDYRKTLSIFPPVKPYPKHLHLFGTGAQTSFVRRRWISRSNLGW